MFSTKNYTHHSTTFWLVVGLGILFLSGCPPRQTDIIGPSSQPTTPFAAQLHQIRQQRSHIQSLEGRAKLRVYHPNGRRSTYRLFFQLQRPNRLHFSITVAMQPVVIATSDGQQCALYQLTAKTFWHGPASHLPKMLGEFLPPHIPLEQLVPILFGEIPILPGRVQKTSTQPQQGWLQAEIQGSHHAQTLWLHEKNQQFVKTSLTYQGKPPLFLEYGTFRGKPSLPKRVIFQSQQDKQKIVWIFSDYTVNPNIALSSFQQSPPRDTSVQIRPL